MSKPAVLSSKHQHVLKWLRDPSVLSAERVERCWKQRHEGVFPDHTWECFKMRARFLRFARIFHGATPEEQVEYVKKMWPDEPGDKS